MNMIMDSQHHHHPQPQTSPAGLRSPQRAELQISTTPPTRASPTQQQQQQQHTPNSNNNNNNNSNLTNNNMLEKQSGNITPPSTNLGKATTLKRSFDVAFLMMPDDRIKHKQLEKQARLLDSVEQHQLLQQRQQHYVHDLSPRSQQLLLQQQHDHHLQQQQQDTRRYAQISIRSPRIYDDPTVVIPLDGDALPLKSAFTKVTRLESPVIDQLPPPLSPDQLSCPSMSPPIATTPPRTNSGNGHMNGSNGTANGGNNLPPQLNPSIVYQNFRPDYQLTGAFQSVNQMQALQAQQRLKQQLLYRPPLNGLANSPGHGGNNGSNSQQNSPNGGIPPEFLPAYGGFPFPNAAAAAAFAGVAPPEMPRMVQNPAAAAILSTLIPPTLASTFTLTAQNVCAKCNISFRMTSDLVYHMRSHHKSEVACDPNRRKREEKLKCPVCQESFRERHHLTRHMTAHQDKESDSAPNSSNSAASVAAAAAAAAASNNDEIINVTSGGTTTRHNHHNHHMPRLSNASAK